MSQRRILLRGSHRPDAVDRNIELRMIDDFVERGGVTCLPPELPVVVGGAAAHLALQAESLYERRSVPAQQGPIEGLQPANPDRRLV
jgi:hypothetical protein